MSAIKLTIIGGLFFLLPFGFLIFLVGEVVDMALLVTTPIAELFPTEDVLGIALANVFAWLLVFATCYVAGLLARLAAVSKASSALGDLLSGIIPGYQMIMDRVSGYVGNKESDEIDARTVAVRMGGVTRFGFEVSRDPVSHKCVVFLPNAPDPGVGTIVSVDRASVTEIDVSRFDLLQFFHFYGRKAPEALTTEAGTGAGSTQDQP